MARHKRGGYTLYENGPLASGTLKRLLRLVRNAVEPGAEWKIIKDSTGEVVIQKNRERGSESPYRTAGPDDDETTPAG